MTEPQKAICRYLLKQCYDHGFSSFYDLTPIAKQLGLKVEGMYSEDNQNGLLFEFGPYGDGLLEFSRDGKSASVCGGTHELLEHWCDYSRFHH